MDDVQSQDDSIARSAMPKVYWRVLPLICLAYLCAYMDRVNVSFASVQMNVDLEFSATIYGLAINTVGNIGAFVMPYGWGIARDATGTFQAATVALAVTSVLLTALIFGLRSRVRSAANRPALEAAISGR